MYIYNARVPYLRAPGVKGVLDIVGAELERFDAVCLATALHRVAKLRAPPEQRAVAVQRREFARLTAAICARSPLPLLALCRILLWHAVCLACCGTVLLHFKAKVLHHLITCYLWWQDM